MPAALRPGGFTLVELLIALVLLALLSAMLFGSLRLAGRSWDAGEAKAVEVAEMRQIETVLRNQIASALPKRMRKAPDLPLLFSGTADEMRYVAALPERVIEGGTVLFRLSVAQNGDHGQLVLERMVPEPDVVKVPDFDGADRTVLADRVAELKLAYFGRDPGAVDTEEPTWRTRWDDPQRLPLLVRVDVRPEKGAPWPSLVVAPRRAPEAGCRAWVPVAHRCQGI